jgi:hypothetical protein
MPRQVMMWEDKTGTLHQSEEAAKVANGTQALKEHLIQKYGPGATFNISEVIDNTLEWTNVFLEGQNAS